MEECVFRVASYISVHELLKILDFVFIRMSKFDHGHIWRTVWKLVLLLHLDAIPLVPSHCKVWRLPHHLLHYIPHHLSLPSVFINNAKNIEFKKYC